MLLDGLRVSWIGGELDEVSTLERLREGSITCSTTRKFQSCAPLPLRSFVPLSDLFSSVFDNGERSLFPESDYADWKVRGGLAVYLEMKEEMRD
ncbi:hypothetical protein DBV15_07982 [Temnothorax longispinosus]|uniref:Uncharacterized protein n=1 Tax=Temnothorax longispinosus TaxID=300112 RepID=A0A4S2K7H6_9HYME|nr:hypothetical protein DBV15_07982 [Temnothorax longispinosus]